MSFTREVKNEILNNEKEEITKISLLSSIISNSIVEKNNIKITTESVDIANFIFKLIKEILNFRAKITVRKGYNYNTNYIYILEINKQSSIFEKLGIKNNLPQEYIIADDETKRSYISGVFLIGGSINDPKKSRYHLEFLVNDIKYANFISSLLNEYYLNSKVLKRENKYMIYVKEAEKIGDFLRIINATRALLYYEDIRIYRDHKNMTNRLNNCEQANVDKMISSALEQVKDIELIKEVGALDLLDEKVKEVALYRLKYQESSLQELSEIITLETGKLLTKSGLNHRLKKIKDLSKKIRKQDI